MKLKPMGQPEKLLSLIDKFKEELKALEREVCATIPKKKKQPTRCKVLIDPSTRQPFALKRTTPKARKEAPV